MTLTYSFDPAEGPDISIVTWTTLFNRVTRSITPGSSTVCCWLMRLSSTENITVEAWQVGCRLTSTQTMTSRLLMWLSIPPFRPSRDSAGQPRNLTRSRGAASHLQASAGLMSTAARECYDDLTLSFWVKCEASSVVADEFVVSFGSIRFSLDFDTKTITGHVLDVDDLTWHDVSNASATDWVFVYLRKTATEAVFGFGDLLTPSSETNLTGGFRQIPARTPSWSTRRRPLDS